MASRKLKLEDQIGQARQLVEGGEIDQAIAMCHHIFHYYPRCLEVTRVLGEAYTEKRWLDEAEQLLAFVLNADPQDVLGYVDRGFVAYERNQLDEAIAYYERALELDPNIEQLRGELLRLNRERHGSNRSKLRVTRAGLANQRLRNNLYTQAIEEYTTILRDAPERMDVQVGLLEAYWYNKDLARAESYALALLHDQPYIIKANLILWHIYGVRRHLEKASTYLEHAQMLDPLNLTAEHLFEDAATTDNAISYISMLEAPQIPAFDPEQAAPLPNWLPDWIAGDLPATPKAVVAAPAQPEAGVSLADLGLDTDMIMSLIADSEQHTAERLNQAKLEQAQAAQDHQAALNQLDELRKGNATEENEFGGWLEELSANAPEIDLNTVRPVTGASLPTAAFDLESFDPGLNQEHAELYQLFDELEAAEQSKNQSQTNTGWFDNENSNSEGVMVIEDGLTAEAHNWSEDDFGLDIAPFDPNAAVAVTKFSFSQVESNTPDEAAHPAPLPAMDYSLSQETDTFFNQIEVTTAAKQPAEPLDYAVAQTHSTQAQVTAPASKWQWRDEQGPPPDFVMEAATQGQFEQTAPPVKLSQQVSKENTQMPIRKGGNDDNDLFDWEKEELPDYLQAFAMDEDEAANYSLAMPTAPQADITTPPTHIRPREMEKTGENEVPNWRNSNTNRASSSNFNRGGSEAVEANQGLHHGNGGNLPGWLEATELEDGKNSGDMSASELESFDLEGIQPFSPFATQDFGATAAPDTGSQNAYADIKPFSMDNFQSETAQPVPQPAPPEPPSFNFGSFDDMDMGDLQPFNPDGGASTVVPPPSMQRPNPPAPPIQTQPAFQPKPPTQPFSPSPRPPAIPRQNTPAQSPFDDLSDLQPFDLGQNQNQSGNTHRAENQTSPAPFVPNFPPMSAFGGEDSGFQSFDLNDVKPFSLEDFAEPATQSQSTSFTPPSSADTDAATPKDSETDFSMLDDFGPDLEPFSMEGFGDIPGISKGPTRFGSMTNLPDEPFFPTPTRRPRNNEPSQPIEPGHEAPLRQFPWIKNRQENEKERQQEQEDGETMFKRLAERRKQQMEAEGIEPSQTAYATNEEAELAHPLLSFDEIELLSQNQAKTAAPAPSVEQPQSEPGQANQPLNQRLEDDTFDWALEAAIQTQPETKQQTDSSLDFDMQPFDLNEIAPETSASTTPFAADASNFTFDLHKEPAEPAASRFEFSPTSFDLAATPADVSANQPANPLADLGDFVDFEAFAGDTEPGKDLLPEVFEAPDEAAKPAQADFMDLPDLMPFEPFELSQAVESAPTATAPETELPPVQIVATQPQSKPEAVTAQAASASSSPATQPIANGQGKTQTLESYLQMVKSNPRDLVANLELADAYYQQGQYNQSITYYTGAIKAADKPGLEQLAGRLRGIVKENGASPRFHHVLGDVYMKQGQASLALNEYKLALSTTKAK